MSAGSILLLMSLLMTLTHLQATSNQTILKAVSQDKEATPWIKKSFAIVSSTKDYRIAAKIAQEAHKKLKLKLQLRDLTPNSDTGLSFPKEVCKSSGGWGFPCYVARGRYDDGDYVSIEYSNAFTGFSPDYYIVIISSGPAKYVAKIVKRAKRYYPDAYVKTTDTYLGCMH